MLLSLCRIAGVFDPSTPSEFIGKEIVKCIELAKEGVHAILLVLSTRNRFTAEEMAAAESLQSLFGPKIVKYMIVVFTGGDELDENGEGLDDYLNDGSPDFLLVISLLLMQPDLSASYSLCIHLSVFSINLFCASLVKMSLIGLKEE